MVPAGWNGGNPPVPVATKKTRRGVGRLMLHEMIDGALRARVDAVVRIATVALAAILAAAPLGTASAKDDPAACLGLIKSAEKSQAIPEGLLKAIGFTESGRVTADGRRV